MKQYEWPRITAIHPEHGAYQMDVHCLRSPKGELVLMAFSGPRSYDQVPLVRKTAAALGDTIEPLTEDDITEDMALRLAAFFHDNPDTKVGVIQVERR